LHFYKLQDFEIRTYYLDSVTNRIRMKKNQKRNFAFALFLILYPLPDQIWTNSLKIQGILLGFGTYLV